MRVLVVSKLNWLGPGRILKALKDAGWEVGLAVVPGNMADLSCHVDRKFMIGGKDLEVTFSIGKAIAAFEPDLILPGDDIAVLALMDLRLLAEQGKLHGMPDKALATIKRTGVKTEASKYVESKSQLIEMLAERGIRVPPQKRLSCVADADSFVQEHGYPVILKPDSGYAGAGIHVCDDEESLFKALQTALPAFSKGTSAAKYVIQKMLGNSTATYQTAAVDGKFLSGYALLRVKTHPAPLGPASVIRLIDQPEMEKGARAVVEATRFTGVLAVQYVLEPDGSSPAYVIEVNYRMGVSKHMGHIFGRSLPHILHDFYSGRELDLGSPRVGTTVALYPQEVVRDPSSEYLQGLVDTIDGDPALAEFIANKLEAHRAAKA